MTRFVGLGCVFYRIFDADIWHESHEIFYGILPERQLGFSFLYVIMCTYPLLLGACMSLLREGNDGSGRSEEESKMEEKQYVYQ